GQVDAAPCGSGTCARLALFHHRGLMGVGSTFVSQGLLGLSFTARIGGETKVEGRPAILPEITGTAYLTGFSQLLFDPDDPLRADETAIRVRLAPDPQLYIWGLRFLRECTAARARRNTLIKLRLCQYSQRVMNELVRAEGLEYHAVTKGALYLYRNPAELEAG